MRVATNAYTDSMLNQFNYLTSQQNTLQNQVSTGLAISAPSDNPTGMENTLNYLAANSTQQQYSANITTLQSRATTIDGVLQTLQSVSNSAGEIVTQAGNSASNSQSTLNNYADQVNQLINQVVAAANTKDPSSGQYLFGGTAASQPPFTATTDANGDVTAVTYNGNSSVNQSDIGANLTVSVDIPGANTGASGPPGLITDSQSGADFLNHLISLRNDLQAGNVTAITSTDNANLQKDENNITYQVANNGVQQQQLSTAATFATNSTQSLSQMISNTSSVNLVNAMVQLNQAQTAYQAALESGSKIMSLSLLNYMPS
jgi:flagellar hook-associated protein 3 FlgL